MSVSSQLSERVRIEQRVLSDDGYGGKTVSWSELATVFAQVEPTYFSALERAVADQLTGRAGYRVRIRTRSDIRASMRILWKTHTLLIHALHEADELLDILTYEESL